MSSSTPAFAMDAQVGFETVPAAQESANEDRADAGQHINTGHARRELCPKGISDRPIARARAEGQPGLSTPDCQVRSLTGRRLAPDIGQPGYTVLECASLEPRPSAMREGRVAESRTMPNETYDGATGSWRR